MNLNPSVIQVNVWYATVLTAEQDYSSIFNILKLNILEQRHSSIGAKSMVL